MIPTRPIRKRRSTCRCIGRLQLTGRDRSLFENAAKAGLPQGTVVGLNDFKKAAYGGPYPPIARHHYFHKLSTQDIELGLKGATDVVPNRSTSSSIAASNRRRRARC